VQHQNAPKDTFTGEHLVASLPGRAQTPQASHVDADVEAIRELRERVEHLWGNPAAPSRDDLSARLDLLGAAADHRATDSRPVRQALQEVLLSVGTGALATLSEPTRHRLAALTGITLPGHLSPGRHWGAVQDARPASERPPSADRLRPPGAPNGIPSRSSCRNCDRSRRL
jgi:hypothetical protein